MFAGISATVITRVVDGVGSGVDGVVVGVVALDGAWVGDGVGVAGVLVGVTPVVVGVNAGVGAVVACVGAGVGSAVGVSGACAGTGVGGSGVGDGVVAASVAWELVSVAVGAALGPGVIVEAVCGVPVGSVTAAIGLVMAVGS